MTKKKKDYSKAILERIVGTKSKTYLADEFKKAFAEKYGIKKEELKREGGEINETNNRNNRKYRSLN